MATSRQIQANKLNAQKSTGPRTPEGKAKSSQNAYTHGFFASISMAPGENRDDFIGLCREYQASFKPVGPAERALVETMVTNKWLEMRAYRLQGQAIFHAAIEKPEEGLPKDLGLLIRYHNTAVRNFRAALNDLVKLQKLRTEGKIGFVSQDDEIDGPDTRVPWSDDFDSTPISDYEPENPEGVKRNAA